MQGTAASLLRLMFALMLVGGLGRPATASPANLPRLEQHLDISYEAEFSIRSGRYLAGLVLLEREIAKCKRANACFHARLARAGVLSNIGRHGEGLPILHTLVKEARDRALPPLMLAQTLDMLAVAKLAAGEWGDLIPIVQESRTLLDRAGLGQSGKMAEATAAYGLILAITGRLQDGIAECERSIAIYRALGPAYEDMLASTLTFLAPLSADPAARYAEAEAITLRLFGPDAPAHIGTLDWRADLAVKAGRAKEAEEIRRRIVDAARSGMGETSYKYALALKSLAELVDNQGRPVEALDLHMLSVRIMLDRYGQHAFTAQSALSLGSFLLDHRMWRLAGDFLESAHRISRAVFGDNSPQTALTALKLGTFRADQGWDEQAYPLLLQARNIGLLFGERTWLVANAEAHLALVTERLKRPTDAREHFHKAVDLLQDSPHSYLTMLAVAGYGQFEMRQGDYAKARTLLRIAEEKAQLRAAARLPRDGSLSTASRVFTNHIQTNWRLASAR